MSDILPTTIEIFSVELYVELFQYFDAVHLLHTFSGLNSRIDSIVKQIPLHFDFWRKTVDEYIIQKVLSFVNPQSVQSLKFSVQRSVSAQILADHLLSSFACLRSLTLHIYSDAPCLLDQIPLLANLTSLTIYFWCSCSENGPERIVNSIFNENQINFSRLSLKTLTVYFNEPSMMFQSPFSPAITNIQHLKVHPINYSEFISILPSLLSIRSINVNFWDLGNFVINPTVVPLVQLANCEKLQLTLANFSDLVDLEYLLKHTPNLKVLKRTANNHLMYSNADRWKYVLMKHCHKLQKIEFDYIYQTSVTDNYDDYYGDTRADLPDQIKYVFSPEFTGTATYDDDDCMQIEFSRAKVR
jgi:hypothetical protein